MSSRKKPYTSSGGDSSHLNYYQRTQRQGADFYDDNDDRYNRYQGYNDDDRYVDDHRYDDGSYDDDDYEAGDDYDFGFTPRKKKKKNASGGRSRYDDDYDMHDRRRHRRKKRHPVRNFFLALLVIILILVVLLAVFLHVAFSRLNRVDPVADTTADTATEAAGVTPYSERGVMNILLIGEDARDGETQTRSDTMIICSLNSKTKKITLVSLMRDTYVPIAGTDYSAKLNAAYATGGLETLDETIQESFGIDIDGNAVVDLDGFLSAITSVGNLDIDLSYDEATYMNANEGLGSSVDNAQVDEAWGLVEGVNSLTPEQALCYARMRYVGNSDWDRVNRQKKIIQAAFAKMKSNPFTMLKVMNQAAPSITTDMTDWYLTRACFYALLCGSDMDAATLPGEGMYTAETIDEQAVLVPDLTACHDALISYLYGSAANGDIFKASSNGTTTTDTTESSSSDNGGQDSETTVTQPDDTQYNETYGETAADPSLPDNTGIDDGGTDTYTPSDNGGTGTDNGYSGGTDAGGGYDNSGTDNSGYTPDDSGGSASGTGNSGTDNGNTGYNQDGTNNSGYDGSGTDNSGDASTGTDTSGDTQNTDTTGQGY